MIEPWVALKIPQNTVQARLSQTEPDKLLLQVSQNIPNLPMMICAIRTTCVCQETTNSVGWHKCYIIKTNLSDGFLEATKGLLIRLINQ